MTPPFYLVGGEESPLPAAALSAGSADCHPREGGDLLSNPRPNRLPDTPSPRSSAPKTPDAGAEPRKFLHYNYISEYEKKYKSKSLLSTMLN